MSRLMPRILFAALWIPVLGMAQTAAQAPPAQATAVPASFRVAWVNLEQAVFTNDEGKSLFAELQKFIEGKNAELEAMRKEEDNLRNQLSVQGSKLTDEARTDLEDQIEAKDTTLQRFQQDTQKEINAKRDRTSNYIAKKMLPVIEKLSKEKGLSAVFFYNASRDAWVDLSLNITEEVVKAYNQAYPMGASKAPAPAKKP